MATTIVEPALEAADGTWRALEAVRERARRSRDATLKANITQLYDDVLIVKAFITQLAEENAELRAARSEAQPEIRQVGDANYYFVADKGPYCQPCYDREKKLVALTVRRRFAFAGGLGRKCQLCNRTFFEEQIRTKAQFKSYYRRDS
jgi:hypothetical protein